MSASADRLHPSIDRERACRFATRIVGDRATAEDMVQEASLRSMGRRVVLPGADGRRRYFYRALTNLCRNELRRLRREAGPRECPLPAVAPAGDAHEALVQQEDRERVRQALDRLPEQQRTAVVLKEWEQLRYREIADRMQISETNAATLVYRGMRRLAKDLGPEVDR